MLSQLPKVDSTAATTEARRVYVDHPTTEGDRVQLWSEASASGHFEDKEQSLGVTFDTGHGWGMGLSFSPGHGDNTDRSVNVLGSTRLEMKVKIPKGIGFDIYISESGSGDKSAAAFTGLNGADGENWVSPHFVGNGEWQAISVELAGLQLRTSWGNQNGKRIIDTQALRSVDLFLPGGQGKGTLEIGEIAFAR
jgi:hypothetical protein